MPLPDEVTLETGHIMNKFGNRFRTGFGWQLQNNIIIKDDGSAVLSWTNHSCGSFVGA